METNTRREHRPFRGTAKATKPAGLPAFRLSHALSDEANIRRLHAYCNRLARTPASRKWHRKWDKRLRLRMRIRTSHVGAAKAGGTNG